MNLSYQKKKFDKMITLRPATPNDQALLEYWDKKQHVIDCDPDEDWNWEYELTRDPFWREQLVAEINQRPIGFLQIIDPHHEDSHYWGEIDEGYRAIDIWIGEETDLNKGYGTQIMNLAIERCFNEKNVKAILIDPLKSNVNAQRFYKRLGFEFVEERVFDESSCYVFELKRINKK